MFAYLARILHAYARARAIGDGALVSRLSRRVWPTQIDLNLHMNQSVYPQVMESGRIDLVVRSGSLAAWQKRRANVVLAAMAAPYLVEPLQVEDWRVVGTLPD